MLLTILTIVIVGLLALSGSALVRHTRRQAEVQPGDHFERNFDAAMLYEERQYQPRRFGTDVERNRAEAGAEVAEDERTNARQGGRHFAE